MGLHDAKAPVPNFLEEIIDRSRARPEIHFKAHARNAIAEKVDGKADPVSDPGFLVPALRTKLARLFCQVAQTIMALPQNQITVAQRGHLAEWIHLQEVRGQIAPIHQIHKFKIILCAGQGQHQRHPIGVPGTRMSIKCVVSHELPLL